MIECPVCTSKQSSNELTCQRCQADLSLLVHLNNQGVVYYNEGLRLARLGQEEVALEHLQAALLLNPDYAESYLVMGKLYAQRGAYEEAIIAWHRVLRQAPPDSPLRAKAERGIAKAEELQQRQQREMAAARRRRKVLIAGAGLALFILGIGLTLLSSKVWFSGVTPEVLAFRWRQTLATYPALRQAPLKVEVQGGGLVISGEVPSTLHRDLITAICRIFPPHTLDISQVQVRPTAEAAALERLLTALPDIMTRMGPGRDLLLSQALAGSRLHVAAKTDDRLHLSGTVPLRDARKLVEDIAVLMVGQGRVDISGIHVGGDYLLYRVQAGDYPRGLAQRFFGDPRRWEELRRFSPENALVLKDPRRLQVGAVIKIPKPLQEGEKP